MEFLATQIKVRTQTVAWVQRNVCFEATKLKNVDLTALACYYNGSSYCDSYTACGSSM